MFLKNINIKYDFYFGGGKILQLELLDKNKIKKDLMDTISVGLKSANIAIDRMTQIDNMIIIYCNKGWRNIIDKLLKPGLIMKYTKYYAPIEREYKYCVKISIDNFNKYMNILLQNIINPLKYLLPNANIYIKDGMINIILPNNITEEMIKSKLKHNGIFNIRNKYGYGPTLHMYEDPREIQVGPILFSRLVKQDLFNHVVAHDDYILANFHPNIIEGINNLSRDPRNSNGTLVFELDNKILWETQFQQGAVGNNTIIGKIKDPILRKDIINMLNINFILPNFIIHTSLDIKPTNYKVFKLLFLLLLLFLLVGYSVYISSGTKKRIFLLIIMLLNIYFNYLSYNLGLFMFLISYMDVVNNYVINYLSSNSIIYLSAAALIIMIFSYYFNFINMLTVINHSIICSVIYKVINIII
mgnify:CR=1 FL=1